MARKKPALAPRVVVICVAVVALLGGAYLLFGTGTPLNAPVPVGAKPSQVSTAVLAEAKTLVQTGGVACDVSQAYRVRYGLYEVACRQGLGQILEKEGERAFAHDCVTLAAQAGPGVSNFPTACVLPDNADQTPGFAPMLRDAGANCTPAKARAIVGRPTGRTRFFEVACADGAAFVLEVPLSGKPIAHACADYLGGQDACTLTNRAQVLAWLGRTAKAGGRTCTVSDFRYLTYRTTGETYYELACSGASGFVVETAPGGGFKQAIGCSEAHGLGGGCTL